MAVTDGIMSESPCNTVTFITEEVIFFYSVCDKNKTEIYLPSEPSVKYKDKNK